MIQVRVSKHERLQWRNPSEEQQRILTRLRNAGVPVVGTAFLVSLDRGVLTMEQREGDLLYTWRDR